MPVAKQVNVTSVPITTAALLGGTVITGGTAVKPYATVRNILLNDIITVRDCIIRLQKKKQQSIVVPVSYLP